MNEIHINFDFSFELFDYERNNFPDKIRILLNDNMEPIYNIVEAIGDDLDGKLSTEKPANINDS